MMERVLRSFALKGCKQTIMRDLLQSLTLKVHLDSAVGPDRHWSKISSLLRDIPTSVTQRTFHYIISGADYHPAHPTSSEDRGGELSPSSHKKEEKFRVAGSIGRFLRGVFILH